LLDTVLLRPYQRHTDRELLKMYVHLVAYARANRKLLSRTGFEVAEELELRHYDIFAVEDLNKRLGKT
jgi:hypothetical protein